MDGSQFPADFDFRNPLYVPVFERRRARLMALRAEIAREAKAKEPPRALAHMFAYYKANPADFINDWGMTVDPRNIERGLPAAIPFLLFPRQREWVDWIVGKWKAQEPGLTEKSRDMGISWLSVAVAAWLCIFHGGANVGFGSRKEEYVDQIGSPKSLFWKAREFITHLPREFRGGFVKGATDAHMRLGFPETGSTITGEAGDNIGRGDRASIYFVDESAYLARPTLIDASLSATTNCRQDISSVNGMGNPFAQKRWGGKIEVFIFDWRQDPRKDDAWYAKQERELDPVVLAQEVDRDYTASVEGVVIPGAWIRSAIGAHLVLGVAPTGERFGSLDVADEGSDNCGFCGAHGPFVEHVEEWSGQNGDIFQSVERAFGLCDEHGYRSLRYDADGLGAGVRGDARVLNERRTATRQTPITVEAFRGSAAVFDPEGEMVKGRQNKDYFKNLKAQGWWALRLRFLYTHRAVEHFKDTGLRPDDFDPDQTISLNPKMATLNKLVAELSQPTYQTDTVGKIVVDKTPDGVKSPNLGDSVMIRFSPLSRVMRVSSEALNLI